MVTYNLFLLVCKLQVFLTKKTDFHTCHSHLEPLWLMELDCGLVLSKELGEVTGFDPPLLVENLFLAVDAADDIDIPAELQTLRAQAVQITLAEERAVV